MEKFLVSGLSVPERNVLLSIKPEYLERIKAGYKKWEYRKKFSIDNIKKIFFYSSALIQKIIGYAEVVIIIRG